MRQYAPALIAKDKVLVSDRFKGWPEYYRQYALQHGTAHRVNCTFHLCLNLTSECGANYQESMVWAIQGSQNHEELSKNWKVFEDKYPKHAQYLRQIPPEDWIALELQEKTGLSLYGERTSNMAEQLHSAEAATETRKLHVPALIVEVLQKSGAVLFDVTRAMQSAQHKNLVIAPDVFAEFSKSIESAGNFQLKPYSQTSTFTGTVLYIGRAEGSDATVNLKPLAISCSRCISFQQVCAFRICANLTRYQNRFPCRHAHAFATLTGLVDRNHPTRYYLEYFAPCYHVDRILDVLRDRALLVPSLSSLRHLENIAPPIPVKQPGRPPKIKLKPGPKSGEKRIPSRGEVFSRKKQRSQQTRAATSQPSLDSATAAALAEA